MESFRPASDKPKGEVQLQQEQIQYVDNECCQVAVKSTAAKEERMNEAQQLDTLPHAQAQQPQMATATLKRSKGKAAAAASQFNTLERNMAEVAEQNMRSERALQSASAANTLDRRMDTMGRGGGGGNACDTCDAPLTPASLAGFDHRDLEQRPLTRSVTRATIFDEPPEK